MNASNMQLVDIYGVWYQPWWKSTGFSVTLCLIVCALLALLGYHLYRSGWFFKKLSFDQQALHDLKKLTASSYQTSAQIKDGYFQLTMILKIYLAVRYQLILHDKTDLEIIPMVQSVLAPEQFVELETLLARAFQIKFAHEFVDRTTLMTDVASAQKLIATTMKDFVPARKS